MPGKVNPVIPEVVIQVGDQVIGNDAAITVAGTQGQFELNVRVPLIARNLLDSIKLLAAAVAAARREGASAASRPNEEMLRAPRRGDACRSRPRSTRTSATTAPTEIVKKAAESGRTLREVAIEHGVDDADARRGARPPQDGPPARVTIA